MTLSEYWLQVNEERLHSRSKTWKCFLSGTFTEVSGAALPGWRDEPQAAVAGRQPVLPQVCWAPQVGEAAVTAPNTTFSSVTFYT